MGKKSSYVPPAHHFEDPKQRYDSSILGIWIFLITEILFFGGMFLVYFVYRFKYPEAFAAASPHLDVKLGALNTIILITSSLMMALAVHAAKEGDGKGQVKFLLLTFAFGAAFMGIKAMEYAHKFHESLVPGTNFFFPDFSGPGPELFFSMYFAMTGLHALHMVIGMVTLLVMAVFAHKGRFGEDYYSPVEITGLYWHFVDIVWIFLFPLLYLIGRHL